MKRSLLAAALLVLTGCAALNTPLNHPLGQGENLSLISAEAAARDGEIWVGLAFSGGGMRASAFAHGMLEELRAATATAADPDGILSDVRLVTGVSGGSVTAANFALHGPQSLDRYREIYLTQNAEKYMANSPVNPLVIARGLSGGANGRKTFGRFLDETLFDGATFGDLRKRSNVITWINATDLANQTTFLFTPETFDALCSDLSDYPISDAVAASAAFPLVFSPIVLKSHHGTCNYTEPDWLISARHNPEANSAMRAHAAALESYTDPEKVKYVKLLDGGITDNFGTTGLVIERARARTAYAPMSAQQAVRMKRLLFLVADAGVEKHYKWSDKLRGPGGPQLAMSIARSSMGSASRTGYDAMRLELDNWQRDLVEYRCGLPAGQVRKLRGSLRGWNCRDVKFFVGQVSFDGLEPEMKTRLDEIPTRLRLKTQEVDLTIEAGRISTRQNPELNGFLRSVQGNIFAGVTPANGKPPRRITPLKN
ncbi:patatin-like phospholipase family protein [Thalassovita taeanensis]|uniref:Patatin-like phospholipase n=1 Tax=Thalassovita taeanensis TaxID=657014 RepID=A0A1H9AGR2_9RHOB|nr:patatin-like phospholipase family protein [Thalassovita taeanensis]SEP75775.1 Patatin-like phospholipase [Thalassovita taeanensis]